MVWIADWELQCCGDDFAVGDRVQWRLTPLEDGRAGYFEADPVRATSFYDHHAEVPPPLRSGRVRSIQAVTYVFRQEDRMLVPIAGSAELRDRDRATGWEPESDVRPEDGGRQLVGYLVVLDDLADR